MNKLIGGSIQRGGPQLDVHSVIRMFLFPRSKNIYYIQTYQFELHRDRDDVTWVVLDELLDLISILLRDHDRGDMDVVSYEGLTDPEPTLKKLTESVINHHDVIDVLISVVHYHA